ncbi:hypothetical protein EVAR_89466_1 [Eumeta japonica]|uniref:Uncharacterized protein n=1 Tax=Eumeta variegata TaxID=151549 RepID=A0A4C1ZQF2_EUMVA|nr:hypothetical protein EVAR_89466_1 [Eumeta japonica]
MLHDEAAFNIKITLELVLFYETGEAKAIQIVKLNRILDEANTVIGDMNVKHLTMIYCNAYSALNEQIHGKATTITPNKPCETAMLHIENTINGAVDELNPLKKFKHLDELPLETLDLVRRSNIAWYHQKQGLIRGGACNAIKKAVADSIQAHVQKTWIKYTRNSVSAYSRVTPWAARGRDAARRLMKSFISRAPRPIAPRLALDGTGFAADEADLYRPIGRNSISTTACRPSTSRESLCTRSRMNRGLEALYDRSARAARFK